jgi:hypothetical protein
VTGSYNGYLRVYNPSSLPLSQQQATGDSSLSSYKAHDLIIESAFQAPIIQIETGKFVR